MSIMLLVILAIVLVMTLYSTIGFLDCRLEGKDCVVPLVFSTLLSLWLILSILTPYSSESVTILKVNEVNGVQCVAYNSGCNGMVVTNLNATFNKVIDTEKEDIALVCGKGGWYRGIYWMDDYSIKLLDKDNKAND